MEKTTGSIEENNMLAGVLEEIVQDRNSEGNHSWAQAAEAEGELEALREREKELSQRVEDKKAEANDHWATAQACQKQLEAARERVVTLAREERVKAEHKTALEDVRRQSAQIMDLKLEIERLRARGKGAQ